MGIDNDYYAYCLDEFAYYLEVETMDKEGNNNWNKLNWEKDKANNDSNKELMEFFSSVQRKTL